MIKQLICWLKTRHRNRRTDGMPVKKQVDLNQFIWFEPYRCRDCGYKGKQRL